MLHLTPIVLTIPLLMAAFSDIRRRQIPNAITLPLLVSGLIANLWWLGGGGLKSSFLGVLLGGGFFLILYLLRAMGAGDVKLAAAVGAWVGFKYMVFTLFYTILIGGLLALVQMIVLLAKNRIGGESERLNMQALRKAGMPYGVAIAAGTFCTFIKYLWEVKL